MAKIGIMGGTFNPIHQGHLQMADAALKQAKLDQIWFMPSKLPPHKRTMDILDEKDRSEMIRLAIRQKKAFVFSDFELQREGITYTAETLRLLQNLHPEHQYYFIMGGDSFFQLETWYLPQEIMKRAVILAVSRDGIKEAEMRKQAGELKRKYQADIQLLHMPKADISSSEIRTRLQRGESVRDLVPEPVREYIIEQGLYQS